MGQGLYGLSFVKVLTIVQEGGNLGLDQDHGIISMVGSVSPCQDLGLSEGIVEEKVEGRFKNRGKENTRQVLSAEDKGICAV